MPEQRYKHTHNPHLLTDLLVLTVAGCSTIGMLCIQMRIDFNVNQIHSHKLYKCLISMNSLCLMLSVYRIARIINLKLKLNDECCI